MPEHLLLPQYGGEHTLARRGGGGSSRPDRENKEEFAEVQVHNLNGMQNEHQKRKAQLSEYFDPNLIFRIELRSEISEEELSKFLKRCDIQYISPSPAKDSSLSYRVSLAEKGDLEKITERLLRYGQESKNKTFFNVVESFEPIPPEDKIGEKLAERPLEGDEVSFIDELAHERDLMFVIAAGNNDLMDFPDRYPHYLCENDGRCGIIDPASSIYALTVGSITQDYISHEAEENLAPPWGYPSPFTRTGPGLNGMIKPELVETGGTILYNVRTHYLMETAQTGIVVVNPRWMKEGTLLTMDYGTSLSAPKVANYLARSYSCAPAAPA